MGHGYQVGLRIVLWEHAKALKVPVTSLVRIDGDWAVFAAATDRRKQTPRSPAAPEISNGGRLLRWRQRQSENDLPCILRIGIDTEAELPGKFDDIGV